MITDFRLWMVLRRDASRIARALEDQCWAEVRAKASVLPAREVKEYVQSHAANLVHRQVDELVRRDVRITGLLANKLVVRSTFLLTDRLLRRLAVLRKAA